MWKVDRGNATVASQSHRVCNTKWRGVQKEGKIFLQLVFRKPTEDKGQVSDEILLDKY